MMSTIQEALTTLKRGQFRIGVPRSRQHVETMDFNVHKIRALEGICGKCCYLSTKIDRYTDRIAVRLICRAYHSPIDLYLATPLGETPTCLDLKYR